MSSRGVSVTLNYVLVLAISSVLVTGLIIAGGTFVGDQRERVIEGELRIIGHHVAGNMEQVDRLVRADGADDPGEAHINQTFQQDVTGTSYGVRLVEKGGTPQVVLNASQPAVSVRVNASVETDVATDSFATGGTISVAYDGDELVIRNA